MKHISKWMAMVAIMVTAMVMTSCEEHYYVEEYEDYWNDGSGDYGGNDDTYFYDMANTLRGHWSGRIRVNLKNSDGSVDMREYDTDFEFDQVSAGSTNGRGIEIDYEGNTEVYRSTFSWYIDTKTEEIVLQYDDDTKRRMSVYKYELNASAFNGEMDSADGMESDQFWLSRYTLSKPSLVFRKK